MPPPTITAGCAPAARAGETGRYPDLMAGRGKESFTNDPAIRLSPLAVIPTRAAQPPATNWRRVALNG